MTVSMRVMSAGDGYRYLLRSVVAADGQRDPSTPLTQNYEQTGTPPGFWLGRGVHCRGDVQLQPGDLVTQTQLQRILGSGCDPVTGTPLGRAFPDYGRSEETGRKVRRAAAGFDYTFSVPKSVSVLWAVADDDARAAIVAAHHAAITDVIRLMERDVAATRIGAAGPGGALAQVEVAGLIATAFDHYDSRAGDPQLHTHVVISNKVKTRK